MIILISITVGLILCLLMSVYFELEIFQLVSGILLFLLVLFGYGMFACCNTEYVKYIPADVKEIIKGKHIVVVSTSNKYKIFENYESDLITDTTKMYWQISYNYYHYVIDSDLTYKNK